MSRPTDTPRLIGEYELLEEIARGGAGVIYRARQARVGRVVALKVIRAAGLATPADVQRFGREARAAAALDHPNIVPVYDVGEHDGRPFFTMRLVEGPSLARHLEEVRTAAAAGGPGFWRGEQRRAARLVAAVARAVHHAHQRGLLHRDLKPGNVLLDEQGEPHVTDFGCAKRLPGGPTADTGLTLSGALVGTPEYMAPEQAAGKAASTAADVYGLGAVLFEWLTGRPPFRAETPLETLRRVRDGEVPRPRALNPALDPDLEAVCLKCLEKDPRRRYGSAAELADDLERWLDGRLVRARRHGPGKRFLRWCRRHPRSVALACTGAVVLLAALGLGLAYWDRHRLKETCYEACVLRGGVPEGVGPLDAAEARRHRGVFRFFHRGGRVEKVEAAGGPLLGLHHFLGGLLDRVPRPAHGGLLEGLARGPAVRCLEYAYKPDGSPARVTARNAAGAVVWVFHFTAADAGHYADAAGSPCTRPGSGVAALAFTWSPEGFPAAVRYRTRAGRPRPDRDGSFGCLLEFDGRGLPVRDTNLGADGKPAAHKDGMTTVTRAYDDRGRLVEIAYLGADGRPVLGSDGYARVTFRHDDGANRVEMVYHGPDGRPARTWDGWAGLALSYDDRGRLAEMAPLDTAGRPAPARDGFSRVALRYDEDGKTVEVVCLGGGGRPVLCKDGFARLRVIRDEPGNPAETSWFDAAGRPVWYKRGYARVSRVYDLRGNVLEEVYVDQAGRPAWHKDGYAKVARGYDEDDRVIKEVYLGPDGRPAWHKYGYCQLTRTYDGRGCIIEVSYLDDKGHLVADKSGVARMTKRHDARGRPVELTHHGPDGQPVVDREGCARAALAYDDLNRPVRVVCLGLDGKPVANREGYAEVRLSYDGAGNRAGEAYFDAAGRPARHRDGYSRVRVRHDARGNAIEERFLGPDGKSVRHRMGYARVVTEYDERDQAVRESYFDEAGRPTRDAEGVAGFRRRYDDRGQAVERIRLGPDGRPVRDKDGVARTLLGYDARGNLNRLAFAGPDGRPVRHPRYRYAKLRLVYDERNREADMAYFDAAGKELRPKVVVARVQPGTPAAQAGLGPGDVLEEVSKQAIRNAAHLWHYLVTRQADGGPLTFSVRRGTNLRPVQLTVPGFVQGVVVDDRLPAD
jgi:tRNA A-37 threonylcarbamoyl transferase component Bud32